MISEKYIDYPISEPHKFLGYMLYKCVEKDKKLLAAAEYWKQQNKI